MSEVMAFPSKILEICCFIISLYQCLSPLENSISEAKSKKDQLEKKNKEIKEKIVNLVYPDQEKYYLEYHAVTVEHDSFSFAIHQNNMRIKAINSEIMSLEKEVMNITNLIVAKKELIKKNLPETDMAKIEEMIATKNQKEILGLFTKVETIVLMSEYSDSINQITVQIMSSGGSSAGGGSSGSGGSSAGGGSSGGAGASAIMPPPQPKPSKKRPRS